MKYSTQDLPISSNIKNHLSKDPVMKKLIQSVNPKVNESTGDVYQDLLSSIISQQISVKVARVIYARFLDLFDGITPDAHTLLDADYEVLRSVGLSNQKATYMQNIARFWIDSELQNQDWTQLSDQEIIDLLTQIKGVGEWTVQMILMFSLEREDIMPVSDLIIQLSMIKHYGIEADKKRDLYHEMRSIADQWSPYRSYACRYLWRAKDLIM